MGVKKTRKRSLALYSVGFITARETLYTCNACGHTVGSEELAALAPHRHTFGYDVMVQVGMSLFLQSRNEREIREQLANRGIRISASEVALLAKKFICYLAIAHRESSRLIKSYMEDKGGYILHLDATCEADSPHLFVGLDEISSLVLDAVKLPAERKASIVPFLQHMRTAYGTPAAVVHDMSSAIIYAVEEVFPHTPDFICHFHFLRDIGNDLFKGENDTLRGRLRYFGIQSKLRSILKCCTGKIEKHPESLPQLSSLISEHQQTPTQICPELLLYTIILWALDGKSQGDGYGFPFDRPYVTFFDRLRILRQTVVRLALHQKSKYGALVLADLKPLWHDQRLTTAVKRIHEKVIVFDQLRTAMRIAEPAGKLGLNDPGSGEMKHLEIRVKQFHQGLCELDERKDRIYRKMREQIEKYWEKLFADPISVQTPSGPLLLYPQRTNNILEQFFRSIKQSHCRRSGYAAMNKTLKAMLSGLPLVKNLEHAEYRKIILNGTSSLEERFAQINSLVVRDLLVSEANFVGKVAPEIKRLIKNPKLPKQLISLFRSA